MRELFKVEAREVAPHPPARGRGPAAAVMAWEPKANYVATADGSMVQVWDRHGEHVSEVRPCVSGAAVTAVAWDKDGACLSILQENQGVVTLWDASSRSGTPPTKLDTGLKDPSYMKWSTTGPQLVVGTAKGNVLVYNSASRKKIPVLGKHPKRITCGAWSKANRLALGSEDCTLTLSNEAGDTMEQTELKHAPREMVFAVQKGVHDPKSGAQQAETHLSVNMGGQSLLLYDLNDPDNPLELAFQQRYGSIVTHRWFGDGLMMLGFSEGYLVVISTHISEIGEELFSGKFHQRALYDVAYSPSLKYAAVSGDLGIKLVEMASFKDLKREAIAPEMIGKSRGAKAAKVEWSPDGHILTSASDDGCVQAFLARLPLVHGSCGKVVAYLSSLREITILNDALIIDPEGRSTLKVDLEPSFVAVGKGHVAVGMNNVVMYYRMPAGLEKTHTPKVNEQSYLGKVVDVRLNSRFAAALSGSTVSLHEIEGHSLPQQKFPLSGSEKLTCVALTEHFLMYGSERGEVEFFSLDPDDFCPLTGAEWRHSAPVRRLVPNSLGTRVVVVDALGAAYVYNPAAAEVAPVPSFPRPETGSSSSGTKKAGSSSSKRDDDDLDDDDEDFATSSATNKGAVAIMWDEVDKHVFYAASKRELHTYCYAATTVKGAMVSKLGPVEISPEGEVTMSPKATPIQQGLNPICAYAGTIACQVADGAVTTIVSPAYEHKEPGATRELAFCQTLALLRLKDAWDAALDLNARAYWLALSNKAMEIIDVDLAVRVYRQLGDAGMVVGLERIAHHEDKNLLAGNVMLLFGNYNAAQELFLASLRPVSALEMRRDLLHWDQALKLADHLDPPQVKFISVEYAHQLEFKGEYDHALKMYQSALDAFKKSKPSRGSSFRSGGADTLFSDDDDDEFKVADDSDDEGKADVHRTRRRRPRGGGLTTTKNETSSGQIPEKKKPTEDEEETAAKTRACARGVARCTLRLGDLRRGIAYVKEARDMQLCRECAGILESMSQYAEAAALYETAGQFEKAVAIHIKQHNFQQAAGLMDKVTVPKLHLQYAKACETANKFPEAVKAYEAANDTDSVVRLYLHKLQQPERALDLVRRTASSDGAQMAARFCQSQQDFRGAIEFLLMAERTEEAFGLAKAHGQVQVYTSVLGEHMTPDDALTVAQHYESVHELGLAGKFYAHCGQYARALDLYISCGEKELNNAIEIVGKARSDTLTHTLIDFLMGEPDGVPKDPNYIYRLYIALGNYPQAAKTAVIIARQEQELGNYAKAHAVLYETNIQLAAQRVHVPQALRRAFLLLHSYILIRKMVKRDDHDSAARLLLRVAKNISKFPSHVAPILTSAVIECQRAGLRASAYEYAVVLMRPEHRNQIDPKFRKRIEGMIRRPGARDGTQNVDADVDDPEPETPCPISGRPLARFSLECPTTQEELPMCVVTGRHMEKDDFCICPNSKMPALFSEYKKYILAEIADKDNANRAPDGTAVALDPVCGMPIRIEQLKLSTPADVQAYLFDSEDDPNAKGANTDKADNKPDADNKPGGTGSYKRSPAQAF